MTDLNRNTRTLIVSFVVAIMVLIPLRMVEEGEMRLQMAKMAEVRVLGESLEVKPQEPDPAALVAPYDEIETDCILGLEADALLEAMAKRLSFGQLTVEEKAIVMEDMKMVEESVCD